MKIAALIQAHKDPWLLGEILNRLERPLWSIYVHIDAKSDLKAFSSLLTRADFIKNRIAVHWGGFSQVQTTLLLLKHSLSDQDNTHFALMSGQCLLVRPNAQVIEKLTASYGGNYISIVPMPTPAFPLGRLSRLHFRDMPRLGRYIKPLARVLPKRNIETLLQSIPPYAGSQWWILSRKVVETIIRFLDTNPWYIRAFRHSFCSDEIFFQTLFVHLGFHADGPSQTFTIWKPGRSNPEIITEELYRGVEEIDELFLRKIERYLPPLVG